MSDNLKKLDDQEVWARWMGYINAAAASKKELDRRQNAPRQRVVKSRYSKPDPKINQPGK